MLFLNTKVELTVAIRRLPLANVNTETNGWTQDWKNTTAEVQLHAKTGITYSML